VIQSNDGLERIKPGENKDIRKTIATTVQRKETCGATDTKTVYLGIERSQEERKQFAEKSKRKIVGRNMILETFHPLTHIKRKRLYKNKKKKRAT
jgi:hypothetical protein